MATRFYLPASGTAPASPAYDATWDVQPSPERRPLVTAKTNTALGEQSAAETSASVVDVLARQFVSDQIPSARTIDGTVSAVVRAREGSTAVDGFMQLVLRVVSGDGSTVRGTLYAGATQTTVSATSGDQNEEYPTSSSTRIWNAITLSSVAAEAGDRIVVELGWRACNTATSTHTVFFHLGDPSATGDHTLAAGSTASLCPWVEFSTDVFGGAQTIAIGQAIETDDSRPISVQLAPLGVPVGQAIETDVAQSIAVAAGPLTAPIGQAVETDTANPIAAVAGQTVTVGKAVETDTGQPIAVALGPLAVPMGQAGETDEALPIAIPTALVIPVGQAVETDTSGTITPPLFIGRATETDTAQQIAVGISSKADTADRRNGRTRVGVAYAEVEPALDTLPAKEPVRSMAQSVPAPVLDSEGRPL